MNSTQLEYFCKTAECESLSKAAVILGINQSALSRHIRNLEEALGVALFYRNGRGVVLTAHGYRLLVRASNIMEEIALAEQEAFNARTESVRELVVGLTPTVARVLVVPLANQLAVANPGIKLRFVEGFSGSLLEWIDSAQVDIAVMYQGWAARRLQADVLVREKLCLVTSTQGERLPPKVATQRLSGRRLILPSPKHGLRRLVDLIAAEHRVQLDVVIEADAFASILALVRAGLGSTILPAGAIQDELSRHHLQASLLIEPEVTRTLVLVTPNNRPRMKEHSQFTRIIRDVLQQFEASDTGQDS